VKPDITKISRTVGDIKRRSVFKVSSVYLITAAGLAALAADVMPTFGVPDWAIRFTVLSLFLGLPVAVILAWIFELTNEGVRIDPGIPKNQDTLTLFSNGKAHLSVAVEKNGRWETRDFNNSFTLGRSPSTDIHVDNPSVSRRHARVIFENGVWMLEDLGSRNGTKLNGEQINRACLPPYAEINLSDGGPKIVIKNHDFDMDRTRLADQSNNSN